MEGLGTCPCGEACGNAQATACVQGWDLVLTGHSLGAGAAALIALKLRSRFPGARARAPAPPLMLTCLSTPDRGLSFRVNRHHCVWLLGAPYAADRGDKAPSLGCACASASTPACWLVWSWRSANTRA